MELRNMHAAQALNFGVEHPYDDRVPGDAAHQAALGVLADLSGRSGIGHQLECVDPETRTELVDALAAVIRVACSSPNPVRPLDAFLTDQLRMWRDEGLPAPSNELQSIQAWLAHMGRYGADKTAAAMRGRMTLLMMSANALQQAGPEAEDAAGIYAARSREEVAKGQG
jgi:hypothetical protein